MYVTHKFRATIGKTKLVRDGELVLVAFSGGPSSSALLHLIQEVRLNLPFCNNVWQLGGILVMLGHPSKLGVYWDK